MANVLSRVAPPVAAFFAGAGLEVSGVEDFRFALALWAFAALWLVLVILTWAPVRARLPTPPFVITIQRSKRPVAVAPPPEAEKGFLDFSVDFQRGAEQLTRLVTKLGRETARMSANISRQTPRFKAAQGDPARAQRIASQTAKDMDKFSDFLERSLPDLKSYSESMTGS